MISRTRPQIIQTGAQILSAGLTHASPVLYKLAIFYEGPEAQSG
jgi:hypothetical protein